MKRSILRPFAIGIATLSTVAGMAVGAVSSQAASLGTLTISPATGIDANTMTVDTSGPCTNPSSTNANVTMTGSGFPAAGINVSSNIALANVPGNAAGGYSFPLGDTLQQFALLQSPPATLTGVYTFSFNCRPALGAVNDTFTGTVTFTQHAGSSPTYVANNPAVSTTIALASAPSSPVNTGVPVAFTAHVAASAGTPAGTVQLMDGVTAVGSPTAIDASGNVTISTAFSTAGSHSVTAVFTGGAGFGNSTSSPPIVYTVNQSPADATTTSLAISPASATSVDSVTLTASVADTTTPGTKPTGTVQFADGGANIGSPVAVSAAGTASLSQAFPVGAHSFTAAYIPANAATFSASASTSQAYTVTAFAGVSTSEQITTTIAPGSLTISVADTSAVVLPNPSLNATATFLTTSGRLHAVTVTDDRAGSPGWNINGQVSDFTATSGPTTTPIVGANLGWTPNVIDHSTTQTVAAGPVVLPATPPVLTNAAADPAAGLHTARLLASAPAGAGTGTAHVDALLALNVPTTVLAGTYAATLTLTAI
jgi:hypothetical protein